jgi:LCP family protein required for cell wall assembly
MGLDSRRDQQGQPLPQDILDAMHAGDESSGNYDADVLIVVHMPAGDGPVIAISIPRDDWVNLPGCPTSDCQGKIKAAYRLAYESVMDPWGAGDAQSPTASADAPDVAAREQLAREAGRRAQISAVEHPLQIPIGHFVEITLAAFFQIARVVEPITVCLNEDTSDRYYSGADFHKGIQQINAAQAMGFVRQRRDANDILFTDLDRTRRRQAFMASVVAALRHGGASHSTWSTLLATTGWPLPSETPWRRGQFTEGTVSTADSISAASSIPYGTGAQSAAELMADELGLSAIASDAVAPDTVILTVGS